MTQADSVHSTPPTNTPTTRRSFLSQTAGMAAGGTILALATVSATGDASAPMAALASGEPDPIFAAFARYQKASQSFDAASDVFVLAVC